MRDKGTGKKIYYILTVYKEVSCNPRCRCALYIFIQEQNRNSIPYMGSRWPTEIWRTVLRLCLM